PYSKRAPVGVELDRVAVAEDLDRAERPWRPDVARRPGCLGDMGHRRAGPDALVIEVGVLPPVLHVEDALPGVARDRLTGGPVAEGEDQSTRDPGTAGDLALETTVEGGEILVRIVVPSRRAGVEVVIASGSVIRNDDGKVAAVTLAQELAVIVEIGPD